MSPIFVPHVFWPISSRAASQSKPPVSSVHGNRRCQSWSSSIVEVVLVNSSPNKKAPTLLFSYCCTSDARRRSVRFSIPPRCFDCPACRVALVDLLAVPMLHYGGWRRRPTAWLEETTDGARPHHCQLPRRLSGFLRSSGEMDERCLKERGEEPQ